MRTDLVVRIDYSTLLCYNLVYGPTAWTRTRIDSLEGYCIIPYTTVRKVNMTYKDKKKMYEMQIQRWINIKIKAINLKGGMCCMCGYNKHYGALEFHHTDPSTKEKQWDKLRLCAWDKIVAELEKCILVCANCHREIHHEIKQKEKQRIG